MNYTVDGIEQAPGKFEGEPTYTRYFWEQWLDGNGESYDLDGVFVTEFDIIGDDIAQFPELKDSSAIVIWETEQGFVEHYLK